VGLEFTIIPNRMFQYFDMSIAPYVKFHLVGLEFTIIPNRMFQYFDMSIAPVGQLPFTPFHHRWGTKPGGAY